MTQGMMGSWLSVNCFAWGARISRVSNLKKFSTEEQIREEIASMSYMKL